MEKYNMIEYGPITFQDEKDWGWGNEAPSTSIGACRIIRLPYHITTKKIEIDFYAPVCVAVNDFGIYSEPESANPP